MARGRLLLSLWGATFVDSLPWMGVAWVTGFVDSGLSWSTLADTALLLPAWALLWLAWAVHRTCSLLRRARGLGIPVAGDVLRGTQTHTLADIPSARIRAELSAAKRAFAVTWSDSGNRVRFRWRPFRFFSRLSAQGSVTFDEALGEVRVEVQGDRLNGRGPLFRGAAFIALCQIVRSFEPAGGPGGEHTGTGEAG
ncbi:hypothetical protein [Streptomyces sp. NPDC002580]|uniref:hypothetical protein n=1 Tax=Streptomyces sp. NPDC002580 TaxID=3364653 RepID=UPI0036C161A3